jgi:pimeloyl-ACP methyl ester carboxylesterase
MESSLRMPPGVSPGEPVEAAWSGHRIAGESWGTGPPVYLVHGWGGCRAHLAIFVKPLVAAGHRVIAFDLPSHNESDPGALAPGRTTIVECAHAVRAVVQAHGPAHAIVAHSLGAKAAALATEWGTPVERLVFLAPMGDFSMHPHRAASPSRSTNWHAAVRHRHLPRGGRNQQSDAASGHPRSR